MTDRDGVQAPKGPAAPMDTVSAVPRETNLALRPSGASFKTRLIEAASFSLVLNQYIA